MRISVTIPDDDLAAIDAAATAAGESRSEYLRSSALTRAATEAGRLTPEQRADVVERVTAGLDAAVRSAVEGL